MIAKIIELDKLAREDDSKVKEIKMDLDQRISQVKEKRREEYLKRAKINIDEKEKDEKIKAHIKFSAIEGVYRKKIDKIQKIYLENKEKWINSMINNIIKG